MPSVNNGSVTGSAKALAKSASRKKKSKTGKTRRVKKKEATPLLPSEIVCTPQALAASKNSVELGLLLSMAVVGLYLYGFWESIKALPDVPTGFFHGKNLNLNRLLPDNNIITGDTQSKNNNNIGGSPQHQPGAGAAGQEQRNVAPPNLNEIPEAVWPVKYKEEIENKELEAMIHPGDKKTTMWIPKMWSYPVHHNQQFTREQAMRIGSCIEPDPVTGSFVRGDKCPPEKRTIFIAIASYRDFQCRYTVESAFNRAAHPERIRFGIVDQIVDGEDPLCNSAIWSCAENPHQALCSKQVVQNQVDVYQMEAQLSIGPVFARHLGHRLYRGEYYSTQSDAHVSFTQNWDIDIIEQLEATHNEMAVLSTYLTDVQGSIDTKTGASLRKTRPIMCNTVYEGGVQGMHLRHASQPERLPGIHGTPQLQPWWAAGYSFSRGHFVVNVPYDPYQPMIFQGEEMSIGIRGFTIGYDFYAPERSVCFHHYAVGKNAAVRNKVKHFWENGNLYAGTGKKAMARLLGIVHMNPEVDTSTWDHTEVNIYGTGGVRTPEQFYKTYGIDVVNKTTQGHLCRFVDGTKRNLHREFTPFLRKDGMGIDYSHIDVAWIDPEPDKGGI